MITSESWDLLTVIIGGIATLAIYSFLIKENAFYRFFEHLFIGIAAGFGPIFTIKRFLWPEILAPMLGANIIVYPDGTLSQDYNGLYLVYLLPMLFGLLYYTLYTKRFSWMVKLVIGFSLGVSAGLTFKGFFAEMIPQLVSSFKPLLVFQEDVLDLSQSIFNIVFVFTLLAVMYYFFFTFRTKWKTTEHFSYSGRWLMMVCFGAFFGSTVMARMALLVERLQFLLTDWLEALQSIFT